MAFGIIARVRLQSSECDWADNCLAFASDSSCCRLPGRKSRCHVAIDAMLFPLRLQTAILGVCEQTIISARPANSSRHSFTYGKGGTQRTISAIDLLTALDHWSTSFKSGSSVSATALSIRRIAEFRFAGHPLDQPFRVRHVNITGLYFRALPQPVELLDKCRKPICSAAFRVEIDELSRLVLVLADPLQAKMIDEVRNEAKFCALTPSNQTRSHRNRCQPGNRVAA